PEVHGQAAAGEDLAEPRLLGSDHEVAPQGEVPPGADSHSAHLGDHRLGHVVQRLRDFVDPAHPLQRVRLSAVTAQVGTSAEITARTGDDHYADVRGRRLAQGVQQPRPGRVVEGVLPVRTVYG